MNEARYIDQFYYIKFYYIVLIQVFVTSMSDLLLNWLNDEVQLSKRITNFEEDFHNGFLFGELLAKHSQQLNFHEFIDKDDKASRINNFSHLLQTFTSLRITYDSNIAMKIIGKHMGVAKKILYELKTQLQKTNDNAFTKTNRLSKTLTPLKKIQISKEKFDQVHKEHFVKQLNELHPAQKEIIQKKLLKKFSEFHQKSNLQAIQQQQKQKQSKLYLKSKFHDQQRENLKKSQQFRMQWEAQNAEKWANNMTIRQVQIQKDELYHTKQQEMKIFAKTSSEANALKALQSDIEKFQRKNLKSRKGIIESSDESQKQQKQLKISKKQSSKQKGSPEPRQQRRIPAGENEKKKHQRQKRRRKMIVQQLKKYQLVEIARRERCIIATIEQTSKQEKQIQYEIWRAWQNKNIINENKLLQTRKIKEKDEIRQTNSKFKHDQLLKTYREDHKHEVQSGLKTNLVLQRSNNVKERKQIYSECQKMVLKFLEITQKMYINCQQINSPKIIEEQLQDELIKFIENTKGPQEGTLKLKHYIEGSHEWNIPIKRQQEDITTNPTQDNALPNENVNNYYLGNILKFVFQKQFKAIQKEQNLQKNKIVLSLIGLDFARKHSLAKLIKEKYNFNIIFVQQLIEDKIKDFNQLKNKGLQVSQETQELAQQCYSGKAVSDSIVIKLIQQSIEKYEKSIIVDYPNTYDQAIELCKVLGGVQPNDLLPKTKLSQKIQQFSRLVKPNQTTSIQREIKSCGIDFVWWISVSVQNSLDRMLGRRWIGQKQVHIYDDIDANKIFQGQKAASLLSRNHFKLKNKNSLREWFSLFGINNKMQKMTKLCWQQIEGNKIKQQLQSNILQKIEETISIKNSYKKFLQKNEQLQKQKAKQKQQQLKLNEEIKKKCIRSNGQNLKSQLSIALNKVQVDKDFIQKIAQVWNKSENTTVNCLIKAFVSLQEQHKSKQSYIASIKRNFIGLLTREDHKFHLIKDFQINYNKFLMENEDMLAYDYTKEELHQRVEDLENDLISVIQEKKQDAMAERTAIMNSGWFESQIQFVYETLFLLIQTQLNRFGVSEKIIVDFYSKKFMCSTKNFEPLNPELNNQAYAALDNFKDGLCPKLDKMISEAFRILNREEEVVEDKNKKGGKGAPPPKKDDKKAAKKGGKQEVQQVKEPTKQEVQMKKAINTEKAILRQRLNKIKTLGSSRLKNIYQTIQKLYTQLEDLYVYTHKVQQKAIYSLSKIFKKSIQLEQKIEFQVQIKYVQVTQTEAIRNFHKPQPIILPAKQRISQQNFTLANLHQIFVFIREQSQGHVISTKRLTILLNRLLTNLQLKAMLPSNWKQLTSSQIQHFVRLLDHQNCGYVNLIDLFTFFIFGNFKYPTPSQIEQYILELTNYSSLKQLSQEQFIQKASWFDEQVQFIQNNRIFQRSKHLKSMLFKIFQNKNNILEISRYLDVITLKDMIFNRQIKRGEDTYFDLAFI